MKNKKQIIIISLVILFLGIGIFLFIYLKNKGNRQKLLEKPIPQKSLIGTNEKITVEIKNTDSEKQKYPIYSIKKDIKLQQVQKLAKHSGFKPIRTSNEGYYFWTRENDIISYSTVSNILTVSGKDILRISNEESIGASTFTNIAKEYFGESWEYGLFEEKKFSDGMNEYRVSRKLGSDLYVQMREGLNETDKIQVYNGRVLYARLMLSNFVQTNEYARLIPKDLLGEYIKRSGYPKEIMPDTSILPTELEVDAYSSEYIKATENMTDCISDRVDVIYYYKYIDQDLLTPVYKVSARCDANYKDKKYQIPVTIFTNAIEPKYVLEE